MLYQVNVGEVYKFDFKPMIENYSGIYRLMTIFTPDEILNSGIDIFRATFEPHGVSKANYITNVKDMMFDTVVFKLQDVHNKVTVHYVPEFILTGQPIVNVSPYRRLGLAVNLGIFGDTDVMEAVRYEIEDILTGKAGIESSAVIFSPEEVWMVDEDYSVISEARNAKKDVRNSVYSDNIRLRSQLEKAQSVISAYEAIIIKDSE